MPRAGPLHRRGSDVMARSSGPLRTILPIVDFELDALQVDLIRERLHGGARLRGAVSLSGFSLGEPRRQKRRSPCRRTPHPAGNIWEQCTEPRADRAGDRACLERSPNTMRLEVKFYRAQRQLAVRSHSGLIVVEQVLAQRVPLYSRRNRPRRCSSGTKRSTIAARSPGIDTTWPSMKPPRLPVASNTSSR